MDIKDFETKKESRIANILIFIMTVITACLSTLEIMMSKEYYRFFYIVFYLALFFVISIPFHELGHLVFGKISGYHLVQFQFLFFKWTRKDGKIEFKWDKSPLLGQCLMAPDKEKIETIKFKAYLAGGYIFNLILTLVGFLGIILYYIFENHYNLAFSALLFINFYFLMSNMVPLSIGNIYNDALNIRTMKKYSEARLTVLNSLLLQEGMVEGLKIDEFDDEVALNNHLVLPRFYIHRYPFDVFKTARRIIKREDNPFEEVLNWDLNKRYLPRFYQNQNTAYLAFKRIVDNEEFEYLFALKENKNLFKEKSDLIIYLDDVLREYRNNIIDKDTALTKVMTFNDKKIDMISTVDLELNEALTDLATDYINGNYPKKENTNLENESDPIPGSHQDLLP